MENILISSRDGATGISTALGLCCKDGCTPTSFVPSQATRPCQAFNILTARELANILAVRHRADGEPVEPGLPAGLPPRPAG